MNYVLDTIRRVNTESPGLEPELAQLYALLSLVKGQDTTLRDVHDAWATRCTVTNPAHRSLVPFDRAAKG